MDPHSNERLQAYKPDPPQLDDLRDRVPVFEGSYSQYGIEGQIQSYANLADSVRDKRDPVRRRIGTALFVLFGLPTLLYFAAGVFSGLASLTSLF